MSNQHQKSITISNRLQLVTEHCKESPIIAGARAGPRMSANVLRENPELEEKSCGGSPVQPDYEDERQSGHQARHECRTQAEDDTSPYRRENAILSLDLNEPRGIR